MVRVSRENTGSGGAGKGSPVPVSRKDVIAAKVALWALRKMLGTGK